MASVCMLSQVYIHVDGIYACHVYYGLATIIIGLFCRISSLLYGSFAKETCNLCVCNLCHVYYRMATISSLLKIIGLFCRISSLLYGSFAKETCNFKEPTNRRHPIVRCR